MNIYARSKAYYEVLEKLRRGYKLAFDPAYRGNGRTRHQRGQWMLTNGVGPIPVLQPRLAKTLIKDGAVREWKRTEDVVYWEVMR